MKIPVELHGTFYARRTDCTKYSVGTVAVVGGSTQYSNAPVIAGLGARAGGAGLVRLVVPEVSRICAGALLPEATFMDIGAAGEPPRADVTVIGMGLGRDADVESVLEKFLVDAKGRFVVDADALAIIAESDGVWKSRKTSEAQEYIFTPHEGEAARLLGISRDDVSHDREVAAREIAARYGAMVVLKGPSTLVVSCDGKRIYRNTTGNPFMALGGMGDLLAGVIGARWAYLKGGDAFAAAASAVWLHGAASDALIAGGGDPSIVNTAAYIGSMRTKLDASC